MSINNLASIFLYAGSLVLIAGIIALTILQSMLVGRLRKSLFTFLSVMFYPKQELSDTEHRIKIVGNYLTTAGTITVLLSGLLVWLTK
jgi:hypothetical protein